jgi:hypothetical protein
MFPINLEIYVASGDYTYSDLLELRDKTKDILDHVERLLDEE